MIVDLHFAALNSSSCGQAIGLNIANHRGAMLIIPGTCAMLMPTSISSSGVSCGSTMSQYIRPLPALPPNSPLSVRIGAILTVAGASSGAGSNVPLQLSERGNTMSCACNADIQINTTGNSNRRFMFVYLFV